MIGPHRTQPSKTAPRTGQLSHGGYRSGSGLFVRPRSSRRRRRLRRDMGQHQICRSARLLLRVRPRAQRGSNNLQHPLSRADASSGADDSVEGHSPTKVEALVGQGDGRPRCCSDASWFRIFVAWAAAIATRSSQAIPGSFAVPATTNTTFTTLPEMNLWKPT